MTTPTWWGWTSKQWAAAMVASLMGGPAMAVVLQGAFSLGLPMLALAHFWWWCLATAGERHGRR